MRSIHINASAGNMAWLQYVIEQGRRGHHVLFEPEEIRRAFRSDTKDLSELEPDEISAINKTVNKIVRSADPEAQREVIRDLRDDLRDLLVLLYFQIIDGNIAGESGTRH